jgi:hypothetical protein
MIQTTPIKSDYADADGKLILHPLLLTADGKPNGILSIHFALKILMSSTVSFLQILIT